MSPALFALQLLSSLPQLIQAGLDVRELIARGEKSLKLMLEEKRDPSEAEWAAINAYTKKLRAELHAPT